ncbi:MAG TPA: CoA ester lyase [Thermoanaerobaculia bacterium]|nr:CoA ester lyase [Thermoanaerobaculia bacterium]
MRITRSALFVPGNKPDWIAKALASGPDHLILDLEDSVPDRDKVASRALVKQGVIDLARQGKACSVRVNPFATGLTLGDLEGIFCPELTEVSLPKVETAADLHALDGMLTVLERAAGLEPGSVSTPLTLETARAMRCIFEIATDCRRVRGISLAAGAGGDAARSVGYVWSKAGTETLYLRSKAVLDARAAGIQYPMVASWFDIKDLDGLRHDAALNRSLGFRGQVVMHPTHVPIVNEEFSPKAAEIAYYKGLLVAYEEGQRRGTAAVLYEGDMIDTAMAVTAREMLELAREIGVER